MTTKELIAEVNNMKKWNYTLAPQEVFDEIKDVLEYQSAGGQE